MLISMQALYVLPRANHVPVCLTVRLGVSGLSDISDIIGEIVARGELLPEELGFSEREATIMANRYL